MANPCITEIRTLVGKAKLERAINKFVECSANDSELSSTAILLSGRFHAMQRQHNMGLLAASEFNMQTNRIIHSLLGAIEGMENGAENPPTTPSPTTPNISTVSPTIVPPARPKVFISYTHKDQEIALRLKSKLEEADIEITMDVDNLDIGEGIAKYAAEAVKSSHVTISIVSTNSLRSSWVAYETLQTFMHEQVNGASKFFPCYVDADFFKPNFLPDMVEYILREIEERVASRDRLTKMGIDASHLNSQISRLHKLKNNASEVLMRLTDNFSLDIGGTAFSANVPKLITAIKQAATPT